MTDRDTYAEWFDPSADWGAAARQAQHFEPEQSAKCHVDREQMEHQMHIETGKTGCHFCPDWDCMAIHDRMPEACACTCDLSHLRAAEKAQGRTELGLMLFAFASVSGLVALAIGAYLF